MALEYPLGREDFFDRICLAAEFQMDLMDNSVGARTLGGQAIRSSIGAQLWSGSFGLNPISTFQRSDERAALQALKSPGASFEIGHPFYRYPQADPRGVLLNGATPTLRTAGDARNLLVMEGFPNDYLLRAEDHIGLSWAGGRSYHIIVQGSQSNEGGRLSVEVRPLRPKAAVIGSAVHVYRPTMNAVVVRDGYQDAGFAPGNLAMGARVNWEQTL